MPAARASASIDAPIDHAWRVVTDFSRYAEWNPFIVRVTGPVGPLAVGSTFRLHVRWPDGSGGASSGERVSALEPPTQAVDGSLRAHFAYDYIDLLGRTGLVRATRTQTFTQLPNGPLRYETEEVFRGLLTGFLPLKQVQAGFEAQTKALKALLESR